jgi:hypothetical protein
VTALNTTECADYGVETPPMPPPVCIPDASPPDVGGDVPIPFADSAVPALDATAPDSSFFDAPPPDAAVFDDAAAFDGAASDAASVLDANDLDAAVNPSDSAPIPPADAALPDAAGTNGSCESADAGAAGGFCGIACPVGWDAQSSAPDVCCRTSDAERQCFSQATGLGGTLGPVFSASPPSNGAEGSGCQTAAFTSPASSCGCTASSEDHTYVLHCEAAKACVCVIDGSTFTRALSAGPNVCAATADLLSAFKACTGP